MRMPVSAAAVISGRGWSRNTPTGMTDLSNPVMSTPASSLEMQRLLISQKTKPAYSGRSLLQASMSSGRIMPQNLTAVTGTPSVPPVPSSCRVRA